MRLNLTSGFIADFRELSPLAALARALRASRALGMGDVSGELLANPAYQSHVAAVAKDDTVFFLSHRHYLAKGLTTRQRASVALHHYRHEVAAFDPAYFDAVYRQGGLTLWRDEVDGTSYDIRLMPGNDVLYEGGVSVVFFVNNARVCVVSYSTVPTDVFLPDRAVLGDLAIGESTLFVTRKQLTAEHDYQKAFNKAYDRTTPAHLCFGALTGIAQAQSHRCVIGITPRVHPSCTPEIEHHLETAYTAFWEGLDGRLASPFGFLIELPMKLTPLDELDAKARKRAIARRAHIGSVQQSAWKTMQTHLIDNKV